MVTPSKFHPGTFFPCCTFFQPLSPSHKCFVRWIWGGERVVKSGWQNINPRDEVLFLIDYIRCVCFYGYAKDICKVFIYHFSGYNDKHVWIRVIDGLLSLTVRYICCKVVAGNQEDLSIVLLIGDNKRDPLNSPCTVQQPISESCTVLIFLKETLSTMYVDSMYLFLHGLFCCV